MSKQLSLIILTYNSEKDIYDCLTSVYKYNDIGDGLEIIVVDNNSVGYETMYSKLQELYPDVIVIKNEKNGGYGQGNNIGIRASSAPIIAVMNPDVRLIMPVFNTFIKTLEKPDVVMCGGKQFGAIDNANASFYYDFTQIGFLQSIGRLIAYKTEKYDYKRMWLQGAFFAIRKDVFEQIGLFDEHIFMYAEEFDIHLRIREHFPTYKIKYLPMCKYIHLTLDRPFSENTFRKQLDSNIYVCQKHHLSVKKMLRYMTNSCRYGHLIAISLHINTVAMQQTYTKSMEILKSFLAYGKES